MTDVREIGVGDRPPEDMDWVLVEQAVGGKFFVRNSHAPDDDLNAKRFDTKIAALSEALAWAEKNRVPVVYLRGKA